MGLFEAYKNYMNATFREAQRQNLIDVLKRFMPTEEATVIDIGAGNGEFSAMVQRAIPNLKVSGVEVLNRGEPHIPITLYDGTRIPFVDKSFDYAMVINMLHHTEDPKVVLREAIRVSRKGIIIKEHYADNWFDNFTLTAMEYMNPNAKKLMELPLHFNTEKEWREVFKSLKMVCEKEESRFVSYSKFWDIFFGRHMHFVGRYHYDPNA